MINLVNKCYSKFHCANTQDEMLYNLLFQLFEGHSFFQVKLETYLFHQSWPYYSKPSDLSH